MIKTFDQLKEEYKDYSNVKTKIAREVDANELYRIIKGLYETDKNTPAYYLALSIYGPSYISFRYALAYHQAIPERVYEVTCASYNKNKAKEYDTYFGRFTYRSVPKKVFHLGVEYLIHDGYPVFMATFEKALADTVYQAPLIKNLKEMENYLFTQLRLEEEGLELTNFKLLKEISDLYHSRNVKLLYKYLFRRYKQWIPE